MLCVIYTYIAYIYIIYHIYNTYIYIYIYILLQAGYADNPIQHEISFSIECI